MPVAIDKPSKYFNSVGYTGNSSTQSITGVGFKPDLVWIKDRIGATSVYSHYLFDGVRGATKYIKSNSTDAEATGATYLTSFDTDGFSLGSYAGVNASGDTTISWNWLGANTTASNTSGTITSTVSANTTSGFSIVNFVGTGSVGTVGHGLGVAPSFYVVKRRDGGAGGQWNVYHKSITANNYLILNGLDASSASATRWNNTAPTSSVFTVSTSGDVNNSTNNHIAYCFAEVKGYSKAFSYTGNNSTDGTFVYLGFRPAWVMIKMTNTTGNWTIEDNKRDSYNVNQYRLYPNLSNAEASSTDANIDFLSNGFKIRTVDGGVNGSNTFIGFAVAESPFVSSKGVPVCAR